MTHTQTFNDVANQLAQLVAQAVGKQPGDIDRDLPLLEQDMDSLMFGELVCDVEDHFGIEIANQHTLMADMETINDIAAFIARVKSPA